MSSHESESAHITALEEAGYIVLRRKSHEHTRRQLDRARWENVWQQQLAADARQWAHRSLDEQRRLMDRLNSVCTAATALGVSIQAINAALAEADAMSTPPASEVRDV